MVEEVVVEQLSVYEINVTFLLKPKEAWVRPVSLSWSHIWVCGVGQWYTLAGEFY